MQVELTNLNIKTDLILSDEVEENLIEARQPLSGFRGRCLVLQCPDNGCPVHCHIVLVEVFACVVQVSEVAPGPFAGALVGSDNALQNNSAKIRSIERDNVR